MIDLFPGVRLLEPSETPELARARSWSLGAGRAVVVEQAARVVERQVVGADLASGSVKLLLQARGKARIVHCGRRIDLLAGDSVLLDGARQFRLEMAPGYRQVVFELPRSLLGRRSSRLLGRAGEALSGAQPAHQALFQALHGLVQHVPLLAPEQRAGLLEAVVGLLLSLLGTPQAEEPEFDRRLRRAHADLNAHLADPDLNAALLARLQGISRRRLDALFALQGQSIERLIWERRLERVTEELSNPAHAQRRLIDIALDWGFNSASHFSRSFRRKFGQSPSAFRRARALTPRAAVTRRRL